MTQAVDLGVAYLFNMTSPFVASICSIGSGLKTALVQDNRLFLSVIKPQISSLATGNRQVPNRKEEAFQQVCASCCVISGFRHLCDPLTQPSFYTEAQELSC